MQKNYKDGVHNISNDSYHGSDGVSRSGLWLLKQAPAYYYNRYINPYYVDHKENKNLIMGNLVHCLVLEPDLFVNDYIVKPFMPVLPKVELLKNVGREKFESQKKLRAEIEESNKKTMETFHLFSSSKQVISQDVYDVAKKIAGSVLKDEFTKSLLDGAKIEQSIYWTHKETGLQCKARPDAWLGSIVIDLKTTVDGSYRNFQRSAFNYGYFLQAGMISEALRSIDVKMEKFIIVAVEKVDPYATATFVLDDESIKYGVNLFNRLMADFKKCQDTKKWPDYQMETLSLPRYASI